MSLFVCQSPVSPPEVPPEPEPPNPFNQLTDHELEEYRKEVQRKQDGGPNGRIPSTYPGSSLMLLQYYDIDCLLALMVSLGGSQKIKDQVSIHTPTQLTWRLCSAVFECIHPLFIASNNELKTNCSEKLTFEHTS